MKNCRKNTKEYQVYIDQMPNMYWMKIINAINTEVIVFSNMFPGPMNK